jgi:hypothetical protein
MLNIHDIDIKKWDIVLEKKGYQVNRTIYYNQSEKIWMKIWEKDYKWKNNFKTAYEANYYNNIALIKNIIVDNSKDVLGYISYNLDPHKLDTKLNKQQNMRILDKNINNIKYQKFLNTILDKVKSLSLVYVDLTPNNVGIKDNEYYLCDLEDIVALPQLKNLDYWKLYCPETYVNYICNKYL